jgi:hypothetical protein
VVGQHDEPCDCWLCRSGVPDDLVERLRNVKPLGKSMSAEEFKLWLSAGHEESSDRKQQPPC